MNKKHSITSETLKLKYDLCQLLNVSSLKGWYVETVNIRICPSVWFTGRLK